MYEDITRIKVMRKRILDNLNMMYPTGMQLDSLLRTVIPFDPTYSRQIFEKDIAYLAGKKYIEFVDDKIGGAGTFYKKVAVLTVEGKEMADGTMTDEALEI